jgi:predicted nuclease of predicted toxin-antitoxin system
VHPGYAPDGAACVEAVALYPERAELKAEIGQSRASDMEMVNLAREQAWVIITLDADFHGILALSGAASPLVIRIRREGLRGSDRLKSGS